MQAKVAAAIGATGMGAASNECWYGGKRTVIKCAAAETDSIAVTYQMLGRVELVIAALQRSTGDFDLWTLTPEQFEGGMRDSAGSGRGKTGQVRRSYIEGVATSIGRIAPV